LTNEQEKRSRGRRGEGGDEEKRSRGDELGLRIHPDKLGRR
jgi:hypothetical protein